MKIKKVQGWEITVYPDCSLQTELLFVVVAEDAESAADIMAIDKHIDWSDGRKIKMVPIEVLIKEE